MSPLLVRKRELDSAERRKGKNWCFWAADVEKNFTSSLDREENEPFSFGRRETHKITWSDNPPIKVTLFWSRYESKKVTGTRLILGRVAGHRRQGKPRMRWLDSIKEATGLRLEDIKEAVQDRKKWRTLVEEKTRNRERTNVKWIQEKAMANHSCTAKRA